MTKINLIPYPSDLQPKQGSFALDDETCICPDSANQQNAGYLQQLLKPATGLPLDIRGSGESGHKAIFLAIKPDNQQLGDEGYQLTIDQTAIHLNANTSTGEFYAIQTLRQLLPVEIESNITVHWVKWELPCVDIEDQPKFPWRGYMLDEGRHFQGIKTVKKMLDQMALLKLNRFHWHLTDDQGWRIEIKKYPRLTEVGSKRAGTVVGNPHTSRKHDHVPHEGFYTQDEIREVVAFAQERQIMVIPEIELPGHTSAALAAYPEFSCTGGPIDVITRWGVFPDIYCAGKPETLTFLQNVLVDVFDLFPAPYLHIGGDEAPKKRWKECPDCQAKIREEKIEDEHALQAHLTNQIASFAADHNRQIIFWSDAFNPAIDPTAIVHFWVGNRKQVLESVSQGREMISSPYFSTYLDQTYTTIPLKKTIEFDPIFDSLPPDAQKRVLGFEGLAWGEFLPNYRRVEYQTFPRLIALAEAGWRKDQDSSDDFNKRLGIFLKRLDLLDIGYAPLNKTGPSLWQRLQKFLQIVRPKTGISLPVEEQ